MNQDIDFNPGEDNVGGSNMNEPTPTPDADIPQDDSQMDGPKEKRIDNT